MKIFYISDSGKRKSVIGVFIGFLIIGLLTVNISAADALDNIVPSSPSNFTVRAFNTADSPAVMDIFWQTPEDNIGVAGYVLERSTNSEFKNPLIYNLDSVNDFRDRTVVPNTTYFWRIKAKDAAGNLSADWTNIYAKTIPLPVVNKQFTIEGDSSSVGYGMSGYLEGPPEVYSSERWGEKLASLLDGTWNVRTVAKGGDRLLGDIPNDRRRQITSYRKPAYERDVVLLWAGTNDIYGLPSRGIYPALPQEVYDAMKSYVDAVKADGFEVWIMDAYPRSAFGFDDKNAERIVFNNLLRADNSFADKFLDIDAWTEVKSRLNRTFYLADQAHMTREGNQLVANRVYAELVTSPLNVLTDSKLPAGKISALYAQAVSSSGGNGKRTVSLVKGKFPSGLSLIDGNIKGTPSQKGDFTFTIEVRDSLGTSVNRNFTLNIS